MANLAPDLSALLASTAISDEFWAPLPAAIRDAANCLGTLYSPHVYHGVANVFRDKATKRRADRIQRLKEDAVQLEFGGGVDADEAGDADGAVGRAAAADAVELPPEECHSGMSVVDIATTFLPEVLAVYKSTAMRFLADPAAMSTTEIWALVRGANFSQMINEELELMCRETAHGMLHPDSPCVALLSSLSDYEMLMERAQSLVQFADVFSITGGDTIRILRDFVMRFQDGDGDNHTISMSVENLRTPLRELAELAQPVSDECRRLQLHTRKWSRVAPLIVKARDLVHFTRTCSPDRLDLLKEGLENDNGEVEISVSTATATINVKAALQPVFAAATEHKEDCGKFFEACSRAFKDLGAAFERDLDQCFLHAAALQHAVDSIVNRSEWSKETILHSLTNGEFSIGVKDGSVRTTIVYTGYQDKQYTLRDAGVWELRARAQFVATAITIGEVDRNGDDPDRRPQLTRDMVDQFVELIDTVEAVTRTLRKLRQHGHLLYRLYVLFGGCVLACVHRLGCVP